jgi:C-terminal processing protease CtpA/Prc
VVVLLGPGCVSSGEGMALMLDALPQVRTVGQPTRGASGSPAPVPLPNGVDVWFSRWVTERMDGISLEGRGVTPDVPVVHEGPGDPTLAAGLKELERLLAK